MKQDYQSNFAGNRTCCRLLALLCLLALQCGLSWRTLAQTNSAIIATDNTYYGQHRVPPGGGWWGRAGIPGGIPTNYTQFCNAHVAIPGTNIMAVGDGVTDDTIAIQTAMTLCPSNQFVFLPAGSYKVTSPINIGSYTVLRGAGSSGPGATKIYFSNPGHSPTALNISTGGWNYGSCFITNDLIVGSNILYLDASYLAAHVYNFTTKIKAGNLAAITQNNDSNIVNIYNSAGSACNWAGYNGGSNAMTQVVLMTNVNTATGKIQVDHPFYWTFPLTNAPVLEALDFQVNYAGIEHIFIQTTDTNQGGATGAIDVFNGFRCWINDVQIYYTIRDGIYLNQCYECEVDHCFINLPQYNGSGMGYALHTYGPNSDLLWQDNVCVACRHSLIFEGGGSGCVYAYNYCIEDNNSDESPGWVTDDVVMHASHPYLNLFEGNHFHKWDADHVHGSSSHNTAFRNEITEALDETNVALAVWGPSVPYIRAYRGISWEPWNYYENAVGNVIGYPNITNLQGHAYLDPTPQAGGEGFIFRFGFDGEGATASTDTNSQYTGYVHGNAPSWWSNNVPWPPIGSDLSPMVSKLPAQLRYENLDNPITPPPLQPPTNLRIVVIPTLAGPVTNILTGLAGWWALDEGNGTTAGDSSGNGNTGTLQNSPTWVTGEITNALQFNGTDSSSGSYVSVPNAADLQGFTAMTITAWVYLTAYDSVDGSGIVTKNITSIGMGLSDPYELYGVFVTKSGSLTFVISTGVPGSRVTLTSASVVPLNTWTFVSATYDGSTMRIFFNGIADENSTSASITVGSNSQNVLIGAVMFSGYWDVIHGKIDDVRIYNHALSINEIYNQYQWPTTGTRP